MARRKRHRTSIETTTKTEMFLERIRKRRPNFSFSRYVNECVDRDFGQDIDIGLLRTEAGEINRKFARMEERLLQIHEEVKRKNDKEGIRI